MDAIKFERADFDLLPSGEEERPSIKPQKELLEGFLKDPLTVSSIDGLLLRKEFLNNINLGTQDDSTLLCLRILGNIKTYARIPVENAQSVGSLKPLTFDAHASLANALRNLLAVEEWLSTTFPSLHAGYEKVILEKIAPKILKSAQMEHPMVREEEAVYRNLLHELHGRPHLMQILLKDAKFLETLLHGSPAGKEEEYSISYFHKEIDTTVNEDPRISLILAGAADAKGFARSMESLLNNQASEIEFIVIDQRINGEIFSIARDTARRCSGLRVYTADSPATLLNSLDFGIRKARGRYVAFLQAGDMLEPHILEPCMRIIERNPDYPIIQFSYSNWNMDRKEVLHQTRLKDGEILGRDKLLLTLSADKNAIESIWGKLYRKDSLTYSENYISPIDRYGLRFLLEAYLKTGKLLQSSLPAWRYSGEKHLTELARISFSDEILNFHIIGDILKDAGISTERNVILKKKIARSMDYRNLLATIEDHITSPQGASSEEAESLLRADIHILEAFLNYYISIAEEYREAQ